MRNPKFIGVFSEKNAGGSSIFNGPYYFVWQLDDANFAMQKLDKAFVPVARPQGITASALKSGFKMEPGILAVPISTPDFRFLGTGQQKQPQRATELSDDALANLERARKTRQVENDLRNNFDKAMRALNRPRDRKGALAALEKLGETQKGIAPEHKHMFRDFGVRLRKKALPRLALIYARRAAELAPNDDHAHFNLARILGILGRYEDADKHLQKAMSLDSSEPVYEKLQKYLHDEQEQALAHKQIDYND